MTVSVDKLAERLIASKLMSIDEFSTFVEGLSDPPDNAQELAKALIRSGKLTRYQATAVYQGKTRLLSTARIWTTSSVRAARCPSKRRSNASSKPPTV